MTFDTVLTVNLVLCIIILVLGLLGYQRSGDKVPLYIAIAFTLFGVSHLLTLLGFGQGLASILVVIRTLGYLMIVFTVYQAAFKQR
ncbi:MAG: hypothetical protein ABIH46_03585 [Chloroflexota bacterium]